VFIIDNGAIRYRNDIDGFRNDEANHAPYGIFLAHPGVEGTGDRSLLDVKGYVLRHFDLKEEG